jgi:biopolymer transport protein ExbD
MAEVQIASKKVKGVKRMKKLSTRVDLTPMVDLGFLLITFFIFTTTMAKSKGIQLTMPDTKPTTEPSKYPQDKTLNVVLENDAVYYYKGTSVENAHQCSMKEVRDVIMKEKEYVARKYGDGKQLLVLIKPTDNASYQNFVDMLDEILINDIKRYMVVDTSAEDVALTSKRN